MTIKDYIVQKLKAFQLTEADMMDFFLASGLDVEAEYGEENEQMVGENLIKMIEGLIFAPRPTSINEGGFSVSWNYADLAKFYMWLCRRYGVKPNEDVASLLGISMIIDKTNIW